jgi:plasmid stabilization system protein ParE
MVKRRIGELRDSLLNAVFGFDLRANVAEFQASLERDAAQRALDEAWHELVQADQAQTQEVLDSLRQQLDLQSKLLKSTRDNVPLLRYQLESIRQTAEYATALNEPHPLVTVRIASYRNTEALMDSAIASVMRQTYDNFELVIVNDGPNERTRRAVEGLHDSRIRYEEFPARTQYPDDPHARWMVAGSPGMNRGAELATGQWIAPLDDDDEFTPDHLEVLVALARERGVELAYGALTQKNLANGEEHHIYSAPPAISQFSFQGAIYLAALRAAFRYDEQSWLVGEPGDWNLIRRMSAAGVTMASTTNVVAVMNQVPYTHKVPE